MSFCRLYNNWSESNEEKINKQINMELYASHMYNALYSYFKSDSIGFPGIAEFFKKSADEEMEHARQFMDYQITRGGKVRISAINEPEISFKTSDSALYQGIRAAITLEKKVYDSIVKISKECEDVGLEDFLDDFVQEQLKTQYELGIRLRQLNHIGMDGHGLVDYDKNMF
tara:strand:- start:2754 stop:3266 length:513 start_codon:yes stop_codon:yes gene_type:complete